MFLDRIITVTKEGGESLDLTMAMKGCLGGIIAITTGCAVVAPCSAVVIGMIAGVVNNVGSKTLIDFKIDDAVDAIPVHLGNGIRGKLAVGLFAEPSRQTLAYSGNSTHIGWFYNTSDGNLLLNQFTAACWSLGWVTVVMGPFYFFKFAWNVPCRCSRGRSRS